MSEDKFKNENGYDIDGVWYPRVTRIVSIKAKPALYRFYAEQSSFAESERVKNRSTEEGTAVHEAVEGILTGRRISVSPAIAPAVAAFEEFIKERGIHVEPEYVERRVAHGTHRYAGTVDAVARIGGVLGVLDIKTSLSIFRDCNLQTAAYMEALKPEFPDLKTRWILRIDQARACTRCGSSLRQKGGVHKVRTKARTLPCPGADHEWGPVKGHVELKEFHELESDFHAFLAAKKLWEWENVEMLKRVGYFLV